MISVNMLRYHNEFTKNMTEAQLYELKLKVDFMDAQHKQKNGVSNYVAILRETAEQMMTSQMEAA